MQQLRSVAVSHDLFEDWDNLYVRRRQVDQRRRVADFSAISSSSNRTFKAVAKPVVCTLPQRRHLSQPTQSIMRETFLKCDLNSSFKIYSRLKFSSRKLCMEKNLHWHSLPEIKDFRRTCQHSVQCR